MVGEKLSKPAVTKSCIIKTVISYFYYGHSYRAINLLGILMCLPVTRNNSFTGRIAATGMYGQLSPPLNLSSCGVQQ